MKNIPFQLYLSVLTLNIANKYNMTMRDSIFKLSYFLNSNEKFHIARVNITSSQDLSLHSHDYAEIVWVEKGTGIHHVNGHQIKLSSGDLIMVRPKDRHTFSSTGKGIVIVNVAFPVETLEFFRQRYFECSTLYFWSTGMFPFQMRLSKDIVKRLSSRAEEAMKYGRSNIQLDSLLLFIFRQITANEKVGDSSETPVWLFNAIQKYNSPEFFILGISGFVSLCDRNIDYINRTVKIHFHKSLTELINEFKMQYATTQLSITSMPIKEICTNCGFRNLGHFYKIFRSIYNQTPCDYRRINQMIV